MGANSTTVGFHVRTRIMVHGEYLILLFRTGQTFSVALKKVTIRVRETCSCSLFNDWICTARFWAAVLTEPYFGLRLIASVYYGFCFHSLEFHDRRHNLFAILWGQDSSSKRREWLKCFGQVVRYLLSPSQQYATYCNTCKNSIRLR